jgi:Protein of unknown function, DUF547
MVRFIAMLLLFCLTQPVAASFDLTHATWSALLKMHVHWSADGSASAVDYGALRASPKALNDYLAQLEAVTPAQFETFAPADQRAFLINAYNAWTVKLIVSKTTNPASIKDLGSLFSSPWKKQFFTLLGKPQSLDGVEHGLIRGAPDYDDPRIHFAVNCASIGCPALRPEAYVGARLDAQLEDQTLRFLRDRSRNRADVAKRTLYLSKIFDWYGDDFELPFRGTKTLPEFLARYSSAWGTDIRGFDIDFLDYDWRLNSSQK